MVTSAYAAVAIVAALLLPLRAPAQSRDSVTRSESSRTDTITQNESNQTADEVTYGDYVIRPWRSIRNSLHNKVIHIPIGFALSAFFLLLVSRFKPDVFPAVRWLILVAALGAIAAYFTGTNQAEAFEGSSKEWVVEWHERLGIATAITLWLWAGLSWVPPFKKPAFVVGCIVVLLIVVTGFFGGVIAHG
jgi:uncharacterized membrane protein